MRERPSGRRGSSTPASTSTSTAAAARPASARRAPRRGAARLHGRGARRPARPRPRGGRPPKRASTLRPSAPGVSSAQRVVLGPRAAARRAEAGCRPSSAGTLRRTRRSRPAPSRSRTSVATAAGPSGARSTCTASRASSAGPRRRPARGDDERHRQAVQPTREVDEEAQAGLVEPVRVVDHQQHRRSAARPAVSQYRPCSAPAADARRRVEHPGGQAAAPVSSVVRRASSARPGALRTAGAPRRRRTGARAPRRGPRGRAGRACARRPRRAPSRAVLPIPGSPSTISAAPRPSAAPATRRRAARAAGCGRAAARHAFRQRLQAGEAVGLGLTRLVEGHVAGDQATDEPMIVMKSGRGCRPRRRCRSDRRRRRLPRGSGRRSRLGCPGGDFPDRARRPPGARRPAREQRHRADPRGSGQRPPSSTEMTAGIFTGTIPALMTPARRIGPPTSTRWCARRRS